MKKAVAQRLTSLSVIVHKNIAQKFRPGCPKQSSFIAVNGTLPNFRQNHTFLFLTGESRDKSSSID